MLDSRHSGMVDQILSLGSMDDSGGMDAPYDRSEPVAGWRRPFRPESPPVDHVAVRRFGAFDAEILAVEPAALAERVGVAIQTIREWRRLGRVPPMWRRAVRALVLGDLSVVDPAWKGWKLDSGTLHSRDGGDYVFSTADVMSLPVTRLRLAEAQNALDQLRKPPPPPEPLTLQSNWITSDWDEHRYETDNDDEHARAELKSRREQWEQTERLEREHRMLHRVWRR